MRAPARTAAVALLLAGPVVLAFFSGGYFAEPRLVGALVAWALVLVLALTGPAPLPRERSGRLLLGGLAALTLWSAASVAWAPQGGPAIAAVQRLALYTGALLVGIGALRDPRLRRAVEPGIAAGATIVIGYGLSGRLLPGMIDLARSRSAGGRLEQPITYWNAEGALAAVGLVLAARVAGDPSRPRAMRALAAAAVAPLGAGVYLSYSRGAIAVALLGLVVLVLASRSRAQLRASAVGLATGLVAAVAAAAFPGVASLEGTHEVRDGLIVLILLLVLAVAAAAVTPAAPAGGDDGLPWAARAGRITTAVVLAVAVGLVVGGLAEKPSAKDLARGAQAERLASVSSNRYEYWRIGLQAFGDHPLKGLGAGGFRVEWLKERPISEAVRDVHSIELEQATELGLVGLLAFLTALAGAVMAGRRALRRDPALAAGLCAGALAWFLHASIDWDWQLPAVSLPAMALLAALVTLAER